MFLGGNDVWLGVKKQNINVNDDDENADDNEV